MRPQIGPVDPEAGDDLDEDAPQIMDREITAPPAALGDSTEEPRERV